MEFTDVRRKDNPKPLKSYINKEILIEYHHSYSHSIGGAPDDEWEIITENSTHTGKLLRVDDEGIQTSCGYYYFSRTQGQYDPTARTAMFRFGNYANSQGINRIEHRGITIYPRWDAQGPSKVLLPGILNDLVIFIRRCIERLTSRLKK